MPTFHYQALDKEGKEKTGILEAHTREELISRLKDKQLYLINAEIKKGRLVNLKTTPFIEIVTATRQLANLLMAGLPLVEALSFLMSQFEHKPLGEVLSDIHQRVKSGFSFHYALSQHPKEFSPLYVNMVYAGEVSGTLEVILFRLADLLEQQLNLANRLKTIFIYPTIMLLMGGGVLFFLLTFIVPVVTQVFNQTQQTLPLPTVILINISSWLKKFWGLILMVMGTTLFSLRFAQKKRKIKLFFDRLKLRIPIVSFLCIHTNIINLSRTLATLLGGGVELVKALAVVRETVTNGVIANAISRWQELLIKGVSIASSLEQIKIFPPLFVRMAAAGEKSGKLKELFYKTADIYQSELTTTLNRLVTILELGMILLIGVIIGFIVLAILLPIMEMSQLIR